uniref:Uncharacterized protein n=1 Tax=Rhizophora mucronata TaxID=61149 RepID=A0A2P2IV26_RHIMU
MVLGYEDSKVLVIQKPER